MNITTPSHATSRVELRSNLLARRKAFVMSDKAFVMSDKAFVMSAKALVMSAEGAAAESAQAVHLRHLLVELQPESLGFYWPLSCEFNAPVALTEQMTDAGVLMALPYARRKPVEMHYRRWNGEPPSARDECNMATGDGAVLVPEVVLVPCVAYTKSGHRLGYGGGYFDRWLATHPHVTSVGVAWAVTEITEAEFDAQPHDQALTLVVTESGVV